MAFGPIIENDSVAKVFVVLFGSPVRSRDCNVTETRLLFDVVKGVILYIRLILPVLFLRRISFTGVMDFGITEPSGSSPGQLTKVSRGIYSFPGHSFQAVEFPADRHRGYKKESGQEPTLGTDATRQDSMIIVRAKTYKGGSLGP
ncbi:hypothetical protein PM082_021328 [Marasmius tenuissimus]|nr:hypothetical protein PM082_021328 [Marasmius tenuissimus]